MGIEVKLGGTILPHIFGGTVLSGSLISGLLTTDPSWLGWHFSRLGEGATISSSIFNLTLLFSGCILFTIALVIKRHLVSVARGRSRYIKSSRVFFYLLTLTSLCLVLLAAFPFDRYPLAHHIAGYTMLAATLALALASHFLLPVFSKAYRLVVYLSLFVTVALYIPYFTIHVLPLILIEFIIFLLIYVWFVMFVDTLLRIK